MEKNLLKSKTFWMAMLAAIAPLFPPVQSLMASNPEMVGMIVGGIFSLLRIVSKDKIVIM